MHYFATPDFGKAVLGPGHESFDLLSAENGCVNGCCAGISRYTTTQYMAPGCHEDQEGFLVLSGTGYARIGDEEMAVRPGCAFLAPAGVPHAMRTDDPSVPLEVFWFHAAC